MFRFRPANSARIASQIADARNQQITVPRILSPVGGLQIPLPDHFAHNYMRTHIGWGDSAFTTVKQAFAKWRMFDLGWVRVANLDARIAIGEIVAVEASTLNLWTLNMSRIVEIIDLPVKFGFIYATTRLHVEMGEERFLVAIDPSTEEVWYELEAVSRPANLAARMGLRISRAFQHKFARDSHRRLHELVT